MAKTEAEKALDNITKFKVSITDKELIKSDLKSKYKKWQIYIAKKIGVAIADDFNYCYRVQYKSNVGRLNKNDVILNNEGRGFFVLKELNGVAMIVTTLPSSDQPFVHGSFRVVNKEKVQKK